MLLTKESLKRLLQTLSTRASEQEREGKTLHDSACELRTKRPREAERGTEGESAKASEKGNRSSRHILPALRTAGRFESPSVLSDLTFAARA